MDIKITRNPNPPSPPAGDFGFGSIFTPHMFLLDYKDGGWQNPRIEPYHDLALDPAAKVLHYGQEIFEGMKAYARKDKSEVHMFRPDMNIKRFNISAGRVCMPAVDPELFMEGLKRLIDLDRDWVPESPNALYIRPAMIGTQASLGVKSATEFLFFIIIGPVGSYFAGGIKPLRLKVEERYFRSAPGGTGFSKTGGNYAASLLPIRIAQEEGFDNIIWLDALTTSKVEEMGAMNIAFVYEDRIITAPTGDTILNGVTRDSIGHLCGDFDLNWVEEGPVIAQICADAESGKLLEAFACGTAAVVTPIGVIHFQGKDYQVGHGQEGDVTRKLRTSLCEIHTGTSEMHPEWIVSVPKFESV